MSAHDPHSQERRTCSADAPHRPHQWGQGAGPFGGKWCPGMPDVTREARA